MLVTSRGERLNERVERFAGRTPQQPDEPRRILLDERPEVRRMIGEAEKDIARPAAFEFALKPSGRRSLEQRSKAATRFGWRGKPRRIDEAFSERCGHSRPGRRGPAIEAGRPPPGKVRRTRSPGLIVLEFDRSAMHARDRGGERKSEPGTRPRTRAFEPDEPIEHPRPVRRLNSRTPVGDREHDGFAGPPRGDDDVGFRLGVADALCAARHI